MQATSKSNRAVAGEVWRLLLRCAMTRFGRSSEILQRFGLTPGHSKALLMLDPERPLPMGTLAQVFSCDASTVTWLVDRLEERGLVQRQGLATDRRVKTVALTPLGIATKKELEEELYRPPPELLTISGATLQELRRALADMSSA